MTENVFRSFEDMPGDNHALTIGSFDGVHLGHQFLLEKVIQRARDHGAVSLAVTFDPLPAEVLRPDKAPTRLCSTEERALEILHRGIDRVLILKFDEDMSRQPATEFWELLRAAAQPVAVVVGEDFAFGHKRAGTPAFLAERAGEDGFDLEVVERVNPEGLELSSSSARRALTEHGDVQRAREVLGRYFRISGMVENGDHRGRTLGFPTANLNIPEYMTLPRDGIYAGVVSSNDQRHEESSPALVYVGTRPTFWQTDRIVEVFLLDFDGDLYGTRLTVDFIDRIRGDRRFSSAEELVEQMRRDEAAGRRIFGEMGLLDPVGRE